MSRLFHRLSGLSMPLTAAAIAAAAFVTAPSALAAGPAPTSPYYGRWTVSEDRPVFSVRGKPYKTIDIAPCGNDFCGVSVSDKGVCGPRLFRFLSKNAHGETTLHGHGKWGTARKNIQINTWENEEAPGGRELDFYLGDGHDFGERSENMPKFHAMYRPVGPAAKATCRVK